MKEFVITQKDNGRKLEKWLPSVTEGLGYGQICRFLRLKRVRVNGKPAREGTTLTAGDVVELGLYPESAALPANTRHVEYSSVASATPGFVTLCAKQVRPGMLLMVR